jgi:hypothetical protein
VTVSEFMFLAIGLVLGVASGAALIEIIRARPPARREVRLTVAENAIPRRRATTLADDAFVTVGPEPARGGPADRRAEPNLEQPAAQDRRTNVLTGDPRTMAQPGPARPMPEPAQPAGGRLVGVPVSAGPDPMIGALRATGTAPERPAPEPAQRISLRASSREPESSGQGPRTMGPARGAGAVGLLDRPAAASRAEAPSYSGPCAEERRLADERCELATRAQTQADTAAESLRRMQRAYDTHLAAAETAADAANPKTVRNLKELAQREFRAASKAAGTPDAVEAAARAWLQQINQINRESAGASMVAEREREAADGIAARLERLVLEADAARIGAEMASAACVAARTAVADCDERGVSTAPAAARAAASAPADTVINGPAASEALGIAIHGGGEPRIFRLLHGDDDAMKSLVASLGSDDPEQRHSWEVALAGLIDAIRTDAIEGGFLRFPDDHVFWGPYTVEQNRDIMRALGSLGHRFDGLEGWVDDNVPTQRELSLALGYAGLDPMRVRHWPSEEQTRELFRSVDVAADEYLAGVAGDLTLAEMVEMLGRRADRLVELWNQWGRIRPLLLEEV